MLLLKSQFATISSVNFRVFRHSVLGVTQSEFASILGVSVPTIQAIEKGDDYRMRHTRVKNCADRLGISLEEFIAVFGPDGPSVTVAELSMRAWVRKLIEQKSAINPMMTLESGRDMVETITRRVPHFDMRVPAGGWSHTCEGKSPNEASGWIVVPTDLSDDSFALRIRGDSMEPRFEDGVVVVFSPTQPGERFDPGKPYYFETTDGQCTFKLVYFEPPKNRYRLESLNKGYKPIFVAAEKLARLAKAVLVRLT